MLTEAILLTLSLVDWLSTVNREDWTSKLLDQNEENVHEVNSKRSPSRLNRYIIQASAVPTTLLYNTVPTGYKKVIPNDSAMPRCWYWLDVKEQPQLCASWYLYSRIILQPVKLRSLCTSGPRARSFYEDLTSCGLQFSCNHFTITFVTRSCLLQSSNQQMESNSGWPLSQRRCFGMCKCVVYWLDCDLQEKEIF